MHRSSKILTAAIVATLSASTGAHAGFIVTSTRTTAAPLPGFPALDRVVVNIQAFTGVNSESSTFTVDNQTFPEQLSLISGTFTATPGGAFNMFTGTPEDPPFGAVPFQSKTTNGSFGANNRYTAINFSGTAGDGFTQSAPTSPYTASGDTFALYSFFASQSTAPVSSWFPTGGNPSSFLVSNQTKLEDGSPNSSVLGIFYVTPGAGFTFEGIGNTRAESNTPISFSVAAIPEPSALALFPLAALPLLARRRR